MLMHIIGTLCSRSVEVGRAQITSVVAIHDVMVLGGTDLSNVHASNTAAHLPAFP
jgi:hypothetical protein